jgi:hypothetical protein
MVTRNSLDIEFVGSNKKGSWPVTWKKPSNFVASVRKGPLKPSVDSPHRRSIMGGSRWLTEFRTPHLLVPGQQRRSAFQFGHFDGVAARGPLHKLFAQACQVLVAKRNDQKP